MSTIGSFTTYPPGADCGVASSRRPCCPPSSAAANELGCPDTCHVLRSLRRSVSDALARFIALVNAHSPTPFDEAALSVRLPLACRSFKRCIQQLGSPVRVSAVDGSFPEFVNCPLAVASGSCLRTVLSYVPLVPQATESWVSSRRSGPGSATSDPLLLLMWGGRRPM